jgi:hypothetical protein
MANIRALSICSLLLSALVLPNAFAAEYTLMPSPQTVHVGHFSAALKPVLTINSGDIVIIETVGGPDPEEVDASGVVPPIGMVSCRFGRQRRRGKVAAITATRRRTRSAASAGSRSFWFSAQRYSIVTLRPST